MMTRSHYIYYSFLSFLVPLGTGSVVVACTAAYRKVVGSKPVSASSIPE